MQIAINEGSQPLGKKKGGRGEFGRISLAVYPFEVEFLKNIQYKTFFYFQKNYQIIGEITTTIPRCEKSSKYQLRDPNNLIFFKLYSDSNVVYKWSVYRKYQNGEEEYLESCTMNLKQVVHNFILPQQNYPNNPNIAVTGSNFNAKEMRLKFPQTGLILIFMLLASDDAHQIHEHVYEKFLKKYEDHVLENMPPSMCKADSNFNSASFSSKLNNSLIDMQKKKSGKRRSYENIQSQVKVDQNLIRTYTDPKSNSGEKIEVFSSAFEANPGDKLLSKQISNQQVQKEGKQQEKIEKTGNYNLASSDEKQFEKIQAKEPGLLKLESNQERINQDPNDKKLQLEKLQEIEEERTSKADFYQSQNLAPVRPKFGKKVITLKQLANETKEESSIIQSKFNMRKAIILVLGTIMLFLIAATLGKHISKQKSNKRPKK